MQQNNIYILPKQTLFFKGVAILCILLHNFFHLISPVTYQNEMRLVHHNVFMFMKDFSFAESINAFFSFLGFYGVYLFIFLSGYGLTKSFLRHNTKGGILFIIRHIAKIYILFLVSAGLFIVIRWPDIKYAALLRSLSLTDNYFPERLFNVNGPWWFFSLIIQLYLFFLPMFWIIKKDLSNIIFIFFSYIIIAIYWSKYAGAVTMLYANAIGHLPEFCLGILIALGENKFLILQHRSFNLAVLFISLVVVIAAQFSTYVFIFSFVASVTLALSFFKLIGWQENRFLEYTGKISPYLFGFNGFLFRWDFLALARGEAPFMKIFWCFVWLAVNYIFATAFYFALKKRCIQK